MIKNEALEDAIRSQMELNKNLILREYSGYLDSCGRITQPGKFEGELYTTVLFHEWVMDGFGEEVYENLEGTDESEYIGTVFEINPIDSEVLTYLDDNMPIYEIGEKVLLRYTNSGFVTQIRDWKGI